MGDGLRLASGAQVFGHGHGCRKVCPRHQKNQFLTTITCGEVTRPPRRLQEQAGDRRQTVVAFLMTQRVVIQFEVVNISHHQGKIGPGAAGTTPLFIQRLIETAAIG